MAGVEWPPAEEATGLPYWPTSDQQLSVDTSAHGGKPSTPSPIKVQKVQRQWPPPPTQYLDECQFTVSSTFCTRFTTVHSRRRMLRALGTVAAGQLIEQEEGFGPPRGKGQIQQQYEQTTQQLTDPQAQQQWARQPGTKNVGQVSLSYKRHLTVYLFVLSDFKRKTIPVVLNDVVICTVDICRVHFG